MLMLILAVIMIFFHHGVTGNDAVDLSDGPGILTKTARDGAVYRYHKPKQGAGAAATGLGAYLTGMLSVGIGEVVMPQLAKRNKVPIPVAAATSVFIVIVTVASASFTQISALISAGGVEAVPWHLVAYTIPGVIIGGQIGPRLQGKIPQALMERGIGILFFIIATGMFTITWQGMVNAH